MATVVVTTLRVAGQEPDPEPVAVSVWGPRAVAGDDGGVWSDDGTRMTDDGVDDRP